jgi:N-acetylglucosamine-6-phosphate deacetylase
MKIIDIHTHGIGGYDTRTTDVNHIHKIAEIHGSYGVTEIIPTIYPAAIKVMRENMELIKQAMELQKNLNEPEEKNASHTAGYSSRIIGIHLEGPFLNISKCGALNAMTFLEPNEYNLRQLIEGFEDIIKIITIAPELDGAVKLIKTITNMGIIANMGHSEATYKEADAGYRAGARGITHIFNAMSQMHHREPGLAGFGLTHPDIYIELIADPYHLHEKFIEMVLKVKNNDKIIIVSDSVKEANPFTKGKGVTDMHGRLLGGALTISESAKRLIEKGFDEELIIKCISENPESYLTL